MNNTAIEKPNAKALRHIVTSAIVIIYAPNLLVVKRLDSLTLSQPL